MCIIICLCTLSQVPNRRGGVYFFLWYFLFALNLLKPPIYFHIFFYPLNDSSLYCLFSDPPYLWIFPPTIIKDFYLHIRHLREFFKNTLYSFSFLIHLHMKCLKLNWSPSSIKLGHRLILRTRWPTLFTNDLNQHFLIPPPPKYWHHEDK